MTSAAEAVRRAIARQLAASQRWREAQHAAADRDLEVAALEASRARQALGTGQVREQLEEAVSTRAIDPASHAALLAHLGNAAREEVLARRGVALVVRAKDRARVEGREHTLEALLLEARSPRTMPAALALRAVAGALDARRGAESEALAEGAEREARVLARGPALADEAPAELSEHAAKFFAASTDAARELSARARHAVGAGPDLAGLFRALAPESLDPVFPARGRARRVHAVLAPIELATELARVTIVEGRTLGLEAHAIGASGRARVITPSPELGLASDRALLAGSAEALVRALAAPSLPVEHAVPPRASVVVGLGALFAELHGERAFVARHVEGARERDHARLASAAHTVLAARLACVPLLASDRDDHLRELLAEALALDPAHVSIALLAPPRRTPREARVVTRARLGALALAPALRERFNEDWFRNPRIGPVIRGAAARGGLLTLEAFSAELGASPSSAATRAIELAQSATG